MFKLLIMWIYVVFVNSELNINDFLLPNYDSEWRANNLNTKFLVNRRKQRIQNERVRILDQYLVNKTIYLDEIAHNKIDNYNVDIRRIYRIESEFRNIVGMKGIKYIFKRDVYWRTWREVKTPTGKDIICYKCQNIFKGNCSNCHSGGYWTIEEKPPCPFELFSIQNEEEICGANYTQFKNLSSSCVDLIKFRDLFVSCNNPIETTYRIRRDYNSVTKLYPNIICNWRENCQISTAYVINSEGILFRIINSSNNIIYSRMMKSDNKNYACINDCGSWDPDTKRVLKNDNPLLLDLLDTKPTKKKRENDKIINVELNTSVSNKNKITLNKKKVHLLRNEFLKKKKYDQRLKLKKAGNVNKVDNVATTESTCKKLEKLKKKYILDSGTSDY